MNELIKIDCDFGKFNFDYDRFIDFVQITGNNINRAVVKPKFILDKRPDYLMTQMPAVSLQDDTIVKPKLLSLQRQWFDSNKRLKLCKVGLRIPDFTVTRVDGVDSGDTRLSTSKKLFYAKPKDSHLKLVVDGIIKNKRDKVRKGEITLSLRNKGVNAKEIQVALDALVHHYGALREIDSICKESPTAGRKPSQEYQVMWGVSKFFPQLPGDTEK